MNISIDNIIDLKHDQHYYHEYCRTSIRNIPFPEIWIVCLYFKSPKITVHFSSFSLLIGWWLIGTLLYNLANKMTWKKKPDWQMWHTGMTCFNEAATHRLYLMGNTISKPRCYNLSLNINKQHQKYINIILLNGISHNLTIDITII